LFPAKTSTIHSTLGAIGKIGQAKINRAALIVCIQTTLASSARDVKAAGRGRDAALLLVRE